MWGVSLLLLLIVLFRSDSVSGRPVRVYNKGFNTRSLPSGGWTSWFNVDHPGGTGDYETTHSIVRHFGRGCDGIPCKKPIGIKAISVHGKSPAQEGDRVLISPRRGLTCTDSHQGDHRCADYKVRFYCPGMRQLCHHSKHNTSKHHEEIPEVQERKSPKLKVPTLNKFGTHYQHKNSQAENNILKNNARRIKANKTAKVKNMTKTTEAADNKTRTRTAKGKVENGAAFHKHLLWNDRQADRRRREQFVYNRWKNNKARHPKWFSW